MGDPERERIEAVIGEHIGDADYEAAAAAILRGYGVEVLGYLIAQTHDSDLADEVFATTCEDLWRGLPSFRREASARTWLYRVAYNALQRHRKDAFTRRRRPLSPELAEIAQDVRTRTAPYLRTDAKDAVSELRQSLEPDEQTLLILRIDRGLSWREVGDVMAGDGEPLGEATLAKRFQRVKTKLRRLAEEAGLIPTD